jgi:hypothetical protein
LAPVFMFCAPGLVFGGTEGVGFRFHLLRSRTRFWRIGGRRVPFSCFACPNSFSAVPTASCPVLMFYAPGQRCGGRRVQFSCFALPDSFSAVPRVSGPIFMFSAPELFFGGTDGVGCHFHVLRARTRIRRYRWHRVPFSCFARPNSFSAVSTASCPVFMFCALELVFGGTEGVGSRFHVLRARTRFRRYRGRQVPFSCFALPDTFLKVRRSSGPVFMSCALRLVFGGTEGVGSRLHVLRARTHFPRYRRRLVPFSCFALPNSFSAVPRVSGPIFMFSAPELFFGGTDGVGSRFHVLCSGTRFWRCGGRRVPF